MTSSLLFKVAAVLNWTHSLCGTSFTRVTGTLLDIYSSHSLSPSTLLCPCWIGRKKKIQQKRNLKIYSKPILKSLFRMHIVFLKKKINKIHSPFLYFCIISYDHLHIIRHQSHARLSKCYSWYTLAHTYSKLVCVCCGTQLWLCVTATSLPFWHSTRF